MHIDHLTTLLRERSRMEHVGITFINAGDQEVFLSYHALYKAALHGLAYLQASGLQQGDELVLQIRDNYTFVVTFWACILGGIIPIPVAAGKNEDQYQKLFNIWNILHHPSLIIADSDLPELELFAAKRGWQEAFNNMNGRRLHDKGILQYPEEGQVAQMTADDIAFVQFSSGSTGQPKGVVLRHSNLLANLRAISHAAGYTAADSMISWMPLTHDMGLIGFHLNPLFSGIAHYLMPTELFVRRPVLWLEKTSKHRVTVLCSPNFGYSYLLRYCKPADTFDWDLSAVRIIYNGAEPVSARLCAQFTAYLQPYGLSPFAMRPVYGLAEASLAVTISAPGGPVEVKNIDSAFLHAGNRIIIKKEGEERAAAFVNVGRPILDCAVRIVDETQQELPPEHTGHVLIQGLNVTSGYYNNEEDTRLVTGNGGWLKTGDIGFMSDGSLYIIGREKDIFFVNGQNYYPYDMERALEGTAGIALNKVAVTGGFNHQLQQEEVMAFVLHRGDISGFLPVADAVRKLISTRFGVELDHIIPVKEIPKTTSGKLQRFKLLEQFRNGQFATVISEMQSPAKAPVSSGEALQGDTEQKIAAVWREVLQEEEIYATQNFFELGGNSLKAMEAVMRLSEVFNAALPENLLYKAPIIRELAKEITGHHHHVYTPLPDIGKATYYHASSVQKRLYYHWAAHKDSLAYNIPVAFQLKGTLKPELLAESIRYCISQHDMLRASFSMRPEPVFSVQDVVPFTLDRITAAPGELAALLRSFIQPFDLMQAPLFRIKLINTGADEHILLLDFHHIISDGMSIFYLLKSLFQVYNGQSLPVLRVQYKDYCAWESSAAAVVQREEKRSYWEKQLSGKLPVLELPTDFPRPVIFSAEGARLPFSIDAASSAKLRQLAHNQGCSLHVLLFTIYRTLLWKYTGQDDMIIGIPVASRRHPELQEMQGMFINNLCIRTSTAGDEPFEVLLQQCRAVMEEGLQHGDYLFEEVLEELSIKRDVSRSPVFDTMFVYQNMGMPSTGHSGIHLSKYFFDTGISRFDLSMEVFDEAEEIFYALEYATTLFKADTIRRLAVHFNNLIQSILEQPATALCNLRILPDEELDTLTKTFNQTHSAFPDHTTIHALITEQAYRSPDKTALEYGAETFTYRELETAAGQWAGAIQNAGIMPGDRVGIMLPASPALVAGILGILKAGAVYVPIDVATPRERVSFMLKDSRCRLFITAEAAAEYMPVIMHAGPALSPAHSTYTAHNAGTAGDIAYIIYTSGTTGTPKGVMITHRSLVNYITWAAATYIGNMEAAFPLFTSISFDLTVTSLFTPLVTGNKIVIYDAASSAVAIEDIIRDNKVNVIKLTPAHLRVINNNPALFATGGKAVKRLIVGGENLPVSLAAAIDEKFQGRVVIFNEYGPTEATVGCMIHQFTPEGTGISVPVGKPAANTQLYILDRFLQPVPAGVPGELYIAGEGLALGYWNRTELTASRFIVHPDFNTRMYRTGDKVKMLADGTMVFIGRLDHQLKINGYRVEPEEIEQVMRTTCDITDVVVVPRKGKNEHVYLCAYYVGGALVPEKHLKEQLAAGLPYYMIPERFVRLEKYPLTANGKLDHDALPEPGNEGNVLSAGTQPGTIEDCCRAVWEEVLQQPHISLTDNFYELGGDSIKAVQIVARLHEKGIRVTTADILTYHTIEQVSSRAILSAGNHLFEQGILTGEKEPCGAAAWFFHQQFEDPGHYNQSVLLSLKRPVDKSLLNETFNLLVRHHDALRMNYDAGKKVLFYNNAHLSRSFVVDDITGNPAAVEILYAFKSGFDLSAALLIKAAVVKGIYKEDRLLITAHHLVMDGISWRILLTGLYEVYTALEQGRKATLPPKTAPLLQWEPLTGIPVKADTRHFSIPADMDTTQWQVKHARKVAGTLDESQTDFLLRGAHHIYGTDVPVLLNTALVLTLQEWTGAAACEVEQEYHGRHTGGPDVSGTVGWFTVMYPVWLELPDAPTGRQIAAVKEQLRAASRCWVGQHPVRKRAPVRLNYLGVFTIELDNDLFVYSHEDHGSDTGQDNHLTACLELNAMVVQQQFTLDIIYNTQSHSPAAIQWFKDTFFRHLLEILHHIKEEKESHFTPSDFTMANLDQADLDELFR